jgi:hypothetical protein
MAGANSVFLKRQILNAVILNVVKDLTHEAWSTLNKKRDPSFCERSLTPFGMTPCLCASVCIQTVAKLRRFR